jgi:hypothetical protein
VVSATSSIADRGHLPRDSWQEGERRNTRRVRVLPFREYDKTLDAPGAVANGAGTTVICL